MLKLQIRRLPPVSEDSFACCVLCPEANAHSLSAPLLWDSSCTLLVDFWRSLTVYIVNSGNCTHILSYKHQWQLRHTESYHPTQVPWPVLQSALLGPGNQGPVFYHYCSAFYRISTTPSSLSSFVPGFFYLLFDFWELFMSSWVSSGSLLMATGDCTVGICHNHTFPSQAGCLNRFAVWDSYEPFIWTYLWVGLCGGFLFLFLLIYFFVRGKILMSEILMSVGHMEVHA